MAHDDTIRHFCHLGILSPGLTSDLVNSKQIGRYFWLAEEIKYGEVKWWRKRLLRCGTGVRQALRSTLIL